MCQGQTVRVGGGWGALLPLLESTATTQASFAPSLLLRSPCWGYLIFVHPQPGTIFHSFLCQRSLCNNICGVLEKLLGRAGLWLYPKQDERQELCVTRLAEEQNNWGVIRLLQLEVTLLR